MDFAGPGHEALVSQVNRACVSCCSCELQHVGIEQSLHILYSIPFEWHRDQNNTAVHTLMSLE